MNRHPPRTDQPENVEEIVDKVEQLLKIRPGSTIFLNPDCGFGTFTPRPMNTADQAFKKLETMVAAAKQLRQVKEIGTHHRCPLSHLYHLSSGRH